jgi:hypothetical protein
VSRRHAFVAVPIQGLAANFLQSMKDYPPSQTSGIGEPLLQVITHLVPGGPTSIGSSSDRISLISKPRRLMMIANEG